MEIKVREVGVGEIDELMEWRMRVLREVFLIDDGILEEELARSNRDYYMKAIPEGSHIACFAMVDGQIAGCGGICLYREMPSPDNLSGKCAYLMNVYTQPQHRGEGIGAKTAKWLVGQAERFGAEKIYLETTDAGRRTYEKLGFVEMRDYMKLERSKPAIGHQGHSTGHQGVSCARLQHEAQHQKPGQTHML